MRYYTEDDYGIEEAINALCPLTTVPTKEQIADILVLYEKKWDAKKGVFKMLDAFQKDKIRCQTETIFELLNSKG